MTPAEQGGDVSDCILAIDPGPTESAFVLYDRGSVKAFGKRVNAEVLDILNYQPTQTIDGEDVTLVIEQIAAMGMAVGAEVFETCFWSGRFAELWSHTLGKWDRIKRHQVKIHLCGSMKAKDANIRQALIDKFGGKDAAIGKKKNPGPLYGISGDVWQALAVAVTYAEMERS
jgi:hypothetical protein